MYGLYGWWYQCIFISIQVVDGKWHFQRVKKETVSVAVRPLAVHPPKSNGHAASVNLLMAGARPYKILLATKGISVCLSLFYLSQPLQILGWCRSSVAAAARRRPAMSAGRPHRRRVWRRDVRIGRVNGYQLNSCKIGPWIFGSFRHCKTLLSCPLAEAASQTLAPTAWQPLSTSRRSSNERKQRQKWPRRRRPASKSPLKHRLWYWYHVGVFSFYIYLVWELKCSL